MSPRLLGLTVRAAQAGLALLLAAAVYLSLLPALFGAGGLDLARGMLPHWLFPQPLMNFAVVPTPEMIDRVLQDPGSPPLEWENGADGTVDAATGLPPVEVYWMDGWSLSFLGPTWIDRAWYALPALVSALLLIRVLLLAFRMVGSVRAEGFATSRNAQRLLAAAVIIGLGGSLVQIAEIVGHRVILERSAAAGLFETYWSFTFSPLFAGLLLLVLSRVVRRNAELQEDVTGLV